jgi:hypothetical protein
MRDVRRLGRSGADLLYSPPVSSNGHRRPPRPRIELASAAATPEEAAAITAALERFLADTAPAPRPAAGFGRWQRVALQEGVSARSGPFPAAA